MHRIRKAPMMSKTLSYFYKNAFLLVATFAYILAAHSVHAADRHSGYCDSVQSTSETVKCVQEHHKNAQSNLNAVYDLALDYSDGQEIDITAADLRAAQQSWIAYRDAHCNWESKLAKASGLAHVYKTSCESTLTDQRADILSYITNREDSDIPPEITTTPRWINVLTQQYSNVFWNTDQWQHIDLDCDETAEEIIYGLELVSTDHTAEGGTKTRSYKPYLTFAIIDNKLTGKPEATIIKAPITTDAARSIVPNAPQTNESDGIETDNAETQPITFCSPLQTLAFTHFDTSAQDAPSNEETAETLETEDEQINTPACTAALQIAAQIAIKDSASNLCKPNYIVYRDNAYQFKAAP